MKYALIGVGMYCVVVWVYTSVSMLLFMFINTDKFNEEKEKFVQNDPTFNALGHIPNWLLVMSCVISVILSPILVFIPSKKEETDV